ncbi:MAG TPA: bifunctional diaminohydroxyphosphoribosylaminopyrimidine deaminase/5-amino-6-(5-phosphoribosylamino)uracil reductase RibD, partial [Firmicutes bacterium]|nr:bifunctional diaminohydroxyphosphoribosylaminopyrimidine deaminase/5-amino-6-(5-phosphoribosylamino)uracil reductase RibD [Bacillota bacterium]
MTLTSSTTTVPQEPSDFLAEAERWMGMALDLAAKARGYTSPNPMVGCVVVRDGDIVGAGYHERAGLPHAEAVALDAAGDAARGADLYVTLEPCSHYGRTPPCTERIIRAGVRRVICAHLDPDPRVNGRGVEQLRNAGIDVIVGPGADAARRLNEQYLYWKRTGLSWITAKWAQTLDGRIATRTGSSQWITGEAARREAHRQRSYHDAVLVGIGTVLADDPRLDVRMVDGHQPWHIVLDPTLEIPLDACVIVPERTTVFTGQRIDDEKRRMLQDRGVEVTSVDADRDRLDPAAVRSALGAKPFMSVFVECGPTEVT